LAETAPRRTIGRNGAQIDVLSAASVEPELFLEDVRVYREPAMVGTGVATCEHETVPVDDDPKAIPERTGRRERHGTE